MRFLIASAGAVVLAGCGYTVGGLIEHRAVYLPIFGSESERREHEFDLHRAVSRELMTQGVTNKSDADLEVRGKILDIREPTLVEDPADRPQVGSVVFRVEITLISRPSGKEIAKRVLEESAPFTVPRFESRDTARQAVIDRLARRIVSMLEKEL